VLTEVTDCLPDNHRFGTLFRKMTTQESVKKTTPSPRGDKPLSTIEKKKSSTVSGNNKQSGSTSKSQTHKKTPQNFTIQTEKIFYSTTEQKDRVEGWLKKEGILSWKKRYFIEWNNKIYYKRQKEDSHAIEYINFDHVKEIQITNGIYLSQTSNKVTKISYLEFFFDYFG
jgi:hypothetical protein